MVNRLKLLSLLALASINTAVLGTCAQDLSQLISANKSLANFLQSLVNSAQSGLSSSQFQAVSSTYSQYTQMNDALNYQLAHPTSRSKNPFLQIEGGSNWSRFTGGQSCQDDINIVAMCLLSGYSTANFILENYHVPSQNLDLTDLQSFNEYLSNFIKMGGTSTYNVTIPPALKSLLS